MKTLPKLTLRYSVGLGFFIGVRLLAGVAYFAPGSALSAGANAEHEQNQY